jgi:putative hemolysin/phosphoserine phosphatase
MYGENPTVSAIHAGLECGTIASKHPGMDAISIGPTLQNVHSPDERIQIASVKKLNDFLIETLKRVPGGADQPAPVPAEASDGATIEPLPAEVCDGQAQAMADALGGAEVTQSEAPIDDLVTGASGTGCEATVTGTGEQFASPDAVVQALGGMLEAQGWTQDPMLAAGGPTGIGMAYRNGDQLCWVTAQWQPDAATQCPAGQPISACEVPPEHQAYTVTLNCGVETAQAEGVGMPGMANPASVNCEEQGGTLAIEERGDGGQFGVCYFEDNLQCEEWALLRGECPAGGVKVTGYTTEAARYCAITGGGYDITGDAGADPEQGTCTFANGATCDVWDTYNGKCDATSADPLPSWNAGPTRDAILKFVADVTDPESPSYVTQADRIAVTDNDGTLWTEKPITAQAAFVFQRIVELAPEHPEWQTTQPYQAVLEQDVETLQSLTAEEVEELLFATHAGMTEEAFDATAKAFLDSTVHPRFERPYTETVYQPMLELLAYLRANGFKTFIVSGGGVEFMRAFSEEVYGVSRENVIGSSLQYEFQQTPEGSVLIRQPEIVSFDDREMKPANIQLEVGRRPIVAIGNSDGDLAMFQYTGGRGSPSPGGQGPYLNLLVVHDDPEREYEVMTGNDEIMAATAQSPWLFVSMKNDFETVFPPPSAADPAAVTATEVITYEPGPPTGEPQEGSCWTGSLAVWREDAWRCMVDNAIYDPCFASGEAVICGASPTTTTDSFALTLTEPLPEPEVPADADGHAWQVELPDGVVCEFATGAMGAVGDDRINYFCPSPDPDQTVVILGDLLPGDVWMAKRAVLTGGMPDLTVLESEETPIRTVWQ